MSHIVWDWNGTLFHDIDAVVAATNAIFAGYGLAALSVDDFRAVYARPVWRAYEKLLGRPLREGEWETLDKGFHDHYHELMAECRLCDDAVSALAAWRGLGHSQSLLSMWRHARLVPTVERLGIAGEFTRVDGLRGPGGGPKAEHLVAHLAALGLDPAQVVLVGDSLDDADAAAAVGARAVLYTGGTTSRAALAAVGVPVVDSLTDALAYAQS